MDTNGEQRGLPCPSSSCSSSDAYVIYPDGHGFCFSCKTRVPSKAEQRMSHSDNVNETSKQFLPYRGISESVVRKYGITSEVDDSGRLIKVHFPYGTGSKTREVKPDGEKDRFYSQGLKGDEGAPLFGMDKFAPGSSKYVTITEGEIDAASAYQMLGNYAVVSVRSASSAKKDCIKALDYLNTFDRIYLSFDNDEPGQTAVAQVASLFDFNKVYHVKHTLKDANDYLQEGKQKEYKATWFAASRFLPSDILSGDESFLEVLEGEDGEVIGTWPFASLQKMTYGFRAGECILLTALEGIGKTEVVRAVEHHILTTTDHNIGIIHLEEGKKRLLEGLAGYHLSEPIHLPECKKEPKEVLDALKEAYGSTDRLHVYSHFGSDDPDTILDRIRFMVSACGCKFVFLDHITMAVTGLKEDDERKILDYLSTALNTMVKDLDFTLILVSHVNDSDQTRGSRNISKVAHTHVHLTRDKEGDDTTRRNITELMVKKNRYGAQTGPGGNLYFDPMTFKLQELGGPV